MRKIALLLVALLLIAGCDRYQAPQETVHTKVGTNVHVYVHVIDGHEYILLTGDVTQSGTAICHKQNCKACAGQKVEAQQ